MSDVKSMYRRVMDDHFPDEMTIGFGDQTLVYRKVTWKIAADGEVVEKGLRYGENPGQEAALYRPVNGHLVLAGVEFVGPGRELVSGLDEAAMVRFGKHPGKTNLTDVDAGLGILRYLDRPTAVIIKHNNPCGVASDGQLAEAYRKADLADRIAAFGGAAVFNRPVDRDTAGLLAGRYLEVVAAPDYEEGALDALSRKKDLRVIRLSRLDRIRDYAPLRFLDFKSLIDGGVIVQQSAVNAIQSVRDFLPAVAEHQGVQVRPRREPTARELDDLFFRLGRGTGRDIQFRALRQGPGHGGHRHRRAGPGGRGGDRRVQGVHQACGRALPRPSRPALQGIGPGCQARQGGSGPCRGHRRRNPRRRRRPARGGHGIGCVFPVPGRRGCGDSGGCFRHRPSRRVQPGLGIHRSLQRGRSAGGHGIHRPEGVQALARRRR